MIHFVGAGSGAPDLITVRGMHLLQQADTVIYAGSLVSPELLKYCKPDTEIFNSATMDLDEVLEILITRNAKGKEVVRLHTGDPALYGAIGEQIDELKRQDIDFDVTPGVTAAFSAAAALGQELTLPGITQTVIFTRVEGRTPMPERESIEALSKSKATMAIYLSATRVSKLATELMAGGYEATTPVAICYKVSWPEQKIFITTVGEMERVVKDNDLSLTTLFLVGDVIGSTTFDKSRLYAADFSTCFREATK